MLAHLLRRVRDTGRAVLSGLRRRVLAATKPVVAAPVVAEKDIRSMRSDRPDSASRGRIYFSANTDGG
jgi:hypothetical protein